ncbi:glutamate racemase [Oceanobacillus halotolerans]|uniref:glutamate racemase n=1 Tax=Oceanobacillus halotolerans TaxID=2663380 RepID=UPI0013DA8F31|nr:glutamate racemase [Oceanobacillus halotolerans]
MNQPIGVIDSGVGGLTVVQELMRQLPNEQLIYVGDTLRCPYGPRSKSEVKRFTWEMVDFLLEKKIKMLVIACNTATAFTLSELQETLDIPIIGVIQPGARAAIKVTDNNHIGVIGTEGTIKSDAYPQALKSINPNLDIETLACPSFVPMVEEGIVDGEKAQREVEHSLQPLKKNKKMDSLILGCTHYPLLKETIQHVMGSHVTLLSSSEETARETSTILDVHQLLANSNSQPKHQFYTTGEATIFTTLVNRIFATTIGNLNHVTIQTATITHS